VDGAPDLAGRCAAALRERDWHGDEVLADQLDGAAGAGPLPALRPLPVDLEELATILQGDPLQVGGAIDLETGRVLPDAAIEYARETGAEDVDLDDDERWLRVRSEGSHRGFRDMRDFIGTVADADRADRLSIAISGRGAFRRFKDVLSRWPDELRRWFGFSAERRRGRCRAWLADEGYAVSPAPRLQDRPR
jgi:hypothetical protein